MGAEVRMRAALPVALLALFLLPARLSADLLIVEKTVIRSGDRTIEAVRSTSIKGARMRIDFAHGGKTAVTLYDLPAGETIVLDASKRRAEVRNIAARNAKLEKDYPRQRSTVSITPKQSTQTVAGSTCADHTFAVRTPVRQNGSIVLTLTGTACLAASATGVDDYMAFAKQAHERNLVLGPGTDNYIILALTRAETELYRALTQTVGIPLILDYAIEVEGKGMLAGIVRKPLEGSRVTVAAKLDAAAIDEAMFAVPAGWKREAKK
jgi:hypothetical protein